MFEEEQIQIKPWRETCDRAGRGRAGIADKEQEGRGKGKTDEGVMGEGVRCHTVTGVGFPGFLPGSSSLVLLVPLGCLGFVHPVPSREEYGRTAAWASSKQERWIRRVGVGA